ncbi:MAG: glycosyltransferase family 2 protein [Acidimicrobiia bacterium]|nr:glycosyltransferase family 2 protein [Acidimicrobiia bacterium]
MIRLIIPAFNESGSLQSLLPRLPATVAGHEVEPLVVSDGSTDDTVAVARRLGFAALDLKPNRGKGSAVRAALAELAGRQWDIAVLMDGDGQHDPNDLEALVAPLINGDAEIVVGSRYLKDERRGGTPRNRYAVRWTTVFVLERLLGRRYTDPYCGYRAFTRDALDKVEFCGNRYEGELEVLFDARRCRIDVAEVPVRKIYGSATSKMSADGGKLLGRVRVIRQYLSTIVRKTRQLRATEREDGSAVSSGEGQ